jgi:hypothetical protein
VLLQALLIGALPYAMTRPWQPYISDAGMTSVHFYEGLLKQALLPIDHPRAAPWAERYGEAIEEARVGNFYSGLRTESYRALSEDMFGGPAGRRQGGRELFLELVTEHPGAYFRALGRTLMLFAGAKSLDNENIVHRGMVLSTLPPEERIVRALGELGERIRADFGYPARDSLVLRVIRRLTLPYDRLLLAGSLVTAVGLLVGLAARSGTLLALCGIPVATLLPYAVVLDSFDRYALPAHVLFMANLVILPALAAREVARRRSRHRSMGIPTMEPYSVHDPS